ncbi:MAG: MltA domain-containing protein [Desulfobacterales bacterium]|nr:MltA domain-containing protein [Desulfobacterales bacterium]
MTLFRPNTPRAVFIGLAGLGLLLAGCYVTPERYDPSRPETALVRIAPAQWPELSDDMDYDGLADAARQSLDYLHKLPEERRFRFGPDHYSKAHMVLSLERFAAFVGTRPGTDALNAFLRREYTLYRSPGAGAPPRVLFTGYYEPFLEGRLTADDRFRYPVYGLPRDLVYVDLAAFSDDWKGRRLTGRLDGRRVVPYYAREDIEKGLIDDQAPVIAWVDDPVGLFFLQVQGSGRITLDGGRSLRVQYHGVNGQPYRSIGKLLIDREKIPAEEMSMQRIRAYLEAHPEERQTILNHNPSYVFFRAGQGDPLGSLGVAVTPGRSIATDQRVFPSGALAFIATRKPLTDGDRTISRWTALKRFVFNQDSGGAIKGPGRADLFWGSGVYAETAAGHLKHDGELYFLVLNTDDAS